MIPIFLALVFLGTAPAWAGQDGNTFDPLPLGAVDNLPVIEGCTCEFQRPNAQVKDVTDLIFVSGVDWEEATVHVEENVALTKVAGPDNPPMKKGERAKILFVGPEQLEVELNLAANDVCSQPCDTVGFIGTMRAVRGPRKAATVVVGSCGC